MNQVIKRVTLITGLGMAVYLATLTSFVHLFQCPLYYVIGIPCPTCGMTRAFESLIELDIMQAFYYNPSFILVIVVVIVFVFEEYIDRKLVTKIYYICLILLVLIYIIRMFIYFPNHDVLNYNQESLLNKLLK
jgi:hypothetical protein